MPSALSSPRPAARISRAKSTPPRPTNRCAVIRPWNSFMTPSTSSGSTEPSRMSSRVIDSTSRGRSLPSRTPASSLLIWARKTAALRMPGSSGRGGTGTAAGRAGEPSPTSCSTDAMLTTAPPCRRRRCGSRRGSRRCPRRCSRGGPRLGLAQPAAQHRRDLVGPLADHRRDLAPHPLPLGGLELHRLAVDGAHLRHLLAGALDPQPVELVEYVGREIELLVLLLDHPAAARAQPDQQDEQHDAEPDG